jgi:hypothetical protein
MESLDVPFKQILSTDGIAASRDRARIPVSLFRSVVSSSMSEQIFE